MAVGTFLLYETQGTLLVVYKVHIPAVGESDDVDTDQVLYALKQAEMAVEKYRPALGAVAAKSASVDVVLSDLHTVEPEGYA